MTKTLTFKQLAQYINYSERHIYRLIKTGRLPAPYKPDAEGRKVIFLKSEIDEYIATWSRRVY